MIFKMDLQLFGGNGNKSASGKRKGSSGGTINQNVHNTKNMQQLKSALNSRGIKVDNGIDNLKFNEVKGAIDGTTYVLEEMGCEDMLKQINIRNNGVMSASFYGELNFNDKYFKPNTPDLESVMNSGTFHPKNQNAFTTGAHEAGHLLERAMIKKSANSDYEELVMWNKRTMATKIIGKSANAVKKSYKAQTGQNISINTLIGRVSGYATKNRSEAFAECICDYVANGKNANALSIEVWNNTKAFFGKK